MFFRSLRVDILLLITLMVGIGVQSILFFFGVPCSAWPMWLAFCGMLITLIIFDSLKFINLIILTVVCLVLSAYTFSYTGTDVVNYHFPMQDLLRHGWNPVYCATFEDFNKLLDGHKLFVEHTLFLPRLGALCGALIGSSTGLFVGDSFLNYALLFSLICTTYDFSRRFWGERRFVAILFSFCIASTTKLTAFLAGYVDYIVYAGILLMIFSGTLYLQEKRVSDLVLFVVSVSISSLTKTTGLVVCVLFCLCLMPFLVKDRAFWVACAVIAITVVVVGFSPLMTSWIHYGCPFYPTMSFSAEYPVIDITCDFKGNEDAMRMGYVTRSLYAWVSPSLTEKLCAIVYDKPDFHPEFYVSGGVAGFGTVFRGLLLMSFVSLLLAKKNIATWLCVFLFATTIVTPVKYIGYSRYFLQVWAIPPIAFFNFVANPVYKIRIDWMKRFLQGAIVALPISIAVFCLFRTFAFNGRCLAIELVRQKAICALRNRSMTWRTERACFNSYSLSRRLSVGGVSYVFSNGTSSCIPILSCDGQRVWASVADAQEDLTAAEKEFFIVDSPAALLKFPWRKAYSALPKVLWSGFGKGRK